MTSPASITPPHTTAPMAQLPPGEQHNPIGPIHNKNQADELSTKSAAARFTPKQYRQILLQTLPEIARKVERQKRKKIAAAGLAAAGGVGLVFSGIVIGAAGKKGLDIAGAVGLGASGLVSFGFALYSWIYIEAEEYRDLVEELRHARRSPRPHVFESELLNRVSEHPDWHEDFEGRIATYKLKPKALLNAWPDKEVPSEVADDAAQTVSQSGAGGSSLEWSNTEFGPQTIQDNMDAHRRRALVGLVCFCDVPGKKDGNPLSNFMKMYGKYPDGLELTRYGLYRFRNERCRKTFIECVNKTFPLEYRKTAEQLLHEALTAHGYRGLDYQLTAFYKSNISRKDVYAAHFGAR